MSLSRTVVVVLVVSRSLAGTVTVVVSEENELGTG